MSASSNIFSFGNMLSEWYQNTVAKGEVVTEIDALKKADELNNQLGMVIGSYLTDQEIRGVVDELMATEIITQGESIDIIDEDSKHSIWYNNWAQQNVLKHQRRWNLYRNQLQIKGWQNKVLEALDKDTSRTIDLMGNPSVPGPWQRYGLIIGEVQSGKTANYIGVLNKALDAGYKMIIVLGGHTEDLRKQTQKRIDSDLIGYDSSFYRKNIDLEGDTFQKGFIGFGRELYKFRVGTQAITTIDDDFKSEHRLASMGQTLTGDPRIAVIKKNKAIINNLTTFLKGRFGSIDVPIAVIDDEADWASINTKTEGDKTAINKAIRDLLSVSSRSTYLAITATPFANVFIDHTNQDDLFPRNYIRALKAPSNYKGVESYMTEDARADNPHTLQTNVEDVLVVLPYNHKIDAVFNQIPNSLKTAIYTFILATAIRRSRGNQAEPSSMMVNISRFNPVQGRVQESIDEFVGNLRNIIRYTELGGEDLPDEVNELRKTLSSIYPDLVESSFSDLFPHIQGVLEDILVELVNNTTVKKRQKRIDLMNTEEILSYNSKPKIFIGGNILARGLTLEGLVVSYYLRKTAAADTLLQMGRWFGYRPNYEDLVRIWTSEEIIDLFEYAAEISASLRREIGRMNDMGLTPEEFGLAIQQHPESFRITAQSKSRNASELPATIRLSGHVFESDKLSTRSEITKLNLIAINQLADALMETSQPEKSGASGRNKLWRGIDERLVYEFLSKFCAYEADPFFGVKTSTGAQRIVDALEEEENAPTWNIVFMSGRGKEPVTLGVNKSLSVYPSMRTTFEVDEKRYMLQFGNRRVAAGGDLFSTLTEDQAEELKKRPESAGKRTYSQQYVVDNSLTNPTLMVYLATSETGKDANGKELPDTPVVAVSLAFPHDDGSRRHSKQKVINILANTVYLQVLRDELTLAEDNEAEGDE